MKLILYRWHANNENVLLNALIRTGHEVICVDRICKSYTRDMELAEELLRTIQMIHADGVISFNYFPIISLVCETAGIKYYSWVYDNPHLTLYAKTVGLKCNRIGIFDGNTVEELKSMGIETAFHLPLAVDVDCFEQAIRKAGNNKKFDSDVSFVGSLYSDDKLYFDRYYADNDKKAADIMNLISESLFKNNIDEQINRFREHPLGLTYTIECMHKDGLTLGEDYYKASEKIAISHVFERKITAVERTRLIKQLSVDTAFDFSLYTNSKTCVSSEGTVRYEDEMPLVFNRSKININLTLRSIYSGIPLRVLDIMACGGFVLSNRQPELLECFNENKEIVYFDTPEECIDKIIYYLSHDDERRQISQCGKDKVKLYFSYDKLLNKLLEV